MSSNTKSSGISLGIGTVLFLIFLTLKLAQVGVVATWSWWWVTSPLWIPIALMIVAFIITVLIVIIGGGKK